MTKQRKHPAPPKHPRVIKVGIETIRWLGSAIPGAAYFYDYAPPYFPSARVFGPGLGVAVLLCGYFTRNRPRGRPTRALKLLLLSVVLLTLYSVALNYCTVLPPGRREGSRRQIGFYMFDWSLTEKARDAIEKLPARS